jgi:hypothetical protein
MEIRIYNALFMLLSQSYRDRDRDSCISFAVQESEDFANVQDGVKSSNFDIQIAQLFESQSQNSIT